jgi:hypothetical protein
VERLGKHSVVVNPERPPSTEPGGFLGGLERDFLMVTLDQSGRGLE